ncbi:hypothetical protein ACSSS7_007597 [Eimeria intestinalis]
MPATEYDADSATIGAAVAALRAAAHRAGQSKRKNIVDASIQCNLKQPEPEPEPGPEAVPTSPVTPPPEEEPPRPAEPQPPSVVKGELNINGNVLLATDWDLVDDDVRFAHYPLLDLDCCGVRQQRQAQWKTRPHQRSLPRPLRRIHRDELQEELRLQRLQRIPKHREAFPVRPQAVNPEATDEVRNRVRQTYDHAHSLPLHTDDSYLKLHMKSRRVSSRRLPTPGRFGHRRSSSPIAGRPLSIEVPVCACPRVVPAPDCHCCHHAPPQQLWSVQAAPPQAVPNVVFAQGAPPVAVKGEIPLPTPYEKYPSAYGSGYPSYPEQGGYVAYPSMSYSMEAPIGFPLPPIKAGKI